MKDIFKKDPKSYFQLIFAIIFVVLAYYFVMYFTEGFLTKRDIKETVVTSLVEDKIEQEFVDFSEFGVVHIKVDSPSYAKSNFDVNPSTSIEVYFNREILVDNMIEKFELYDEDSKILVPVEMALSVGRDGGEEEGQSTWKWQKVWKQKVVFTPSWELSPITRYSAVVAPGYLDLAEKEIAKNSFRFEFMTADAPGILSTNLDKGSVLRSNDSIKVFFRSPMSIGELEEKMVVNPLPDNFSFTNNDKVLVINNTFEIGETYNFYIPSHTKDIYGRNLGTNIEYVFTVR